MKKELGLAHCPALQAYHIPSCKGQQVQKMREYSSREWMWIYPWRWRLVFLLLTWWIRALPGVLISLRQKRIRDLSPDSPAISKSADCYIDILDNDSIDKQERVVEELSKAQLVLVLMSPDLKKIRMGKRGVSHCEREKYSNFRNQH